MYSEFKYLSNLKNVIKQHNSFDPKIDIEKDEKPKKINKKSKEIKEINESKEKDKKEKKKKEVRNKEIEDILINEGCILRYITRRLLDELDKKLCCVARDEVIENAYNGIKSFML
jgi:hypothetical protein